MTKSILTSLTVIFLMWTIQACGGLKVGGYDVGKIAQTGAKVVSGNHLSEQQQSDIGQQMAAIILGSSSLHKDESLQAYVNKVGSWVASQSGSKEKQWQFMVIDTPDFNAFSMPGGYVIISSGVIDRLSSEAELAGILAHEISHVAQQHQVKAIEKSNSFSNIGELAFLAADANQNSKGGYSQNSLRNTNIAKGLFDATHSLYTKGLGRDDELDADIRAVVLTARAGYDPYAYLSVMQLVDSIDNKNKTLLLATHPKTTERIEAVAKTIEKISRVSKQTKTLESRFLKET
jgi:predicted Zn-dependent protease